MDYFQPDLAIAGGITEAMRIAALAESHGIKLAPHLWGGALNFACRPSGHGGLAPRPSSPSTHSAPIRCCTISPRRRFEVVDGMIAIPDRPGLGVTIDEEFLAPTPSISARSSAVFCDSPAFWL